MNSQQKAVLGNSLVRYIIVGGTSYAIELLFIFGLSHIANVDKLLAVGIAFWIGLAVSFVLQKLVAFRDTRTQAKTLTAQSIGYGVLVLFNYGFTLLFVRIFLGVTDEDFLIIARTVALIITTVWNYFIYKRFLFKASS